MKVVVVRVKMKNKVSSSRCSKCNIGFCRSRSSGSKRSNSNAYCSGIKSTNSSPCSKSSSGSRIGYSGSSSVSSMKSRSYSKRGSSSSGSKRSSSSSGSKRRACSCTISNSCGGSRSSSN